LINIQITIHPNDNIMITLNTTNQHLKNKRKRLFNQDTCKDSYDKKTPI
jgi:hypothetical protein